ncbi:MAG: hypothetical protein IKA31_04305, partial [Clostridia bacterium]|nr:hypothetical protein [Clostridia bacterium]
HSFNSGTLYVEIWKDGTYQESLSKELKTNTSATIDMSGLTDKYSYYTFKVVYLYKIDWWSFWNDGS